MASDDKATPGPEAVRKARLAQALRENLKRRKAQSRGRVAEQPRARTDQDIDPRAALPDRQS